MSPSLPPDFEDSDEGRDPDDMPPPPGPRLVLGSASPRRRELLMQLGLEPDIIETPDIDEAPHAREKPQAYAQRMAREKAEVLEPHHLGDFIITGDTVVAVGNQILPKANQLAQARACLTHLSGRTHRVYSALTLITAQGQVLQRLSLSRVRFKRLSGQEMSSYLDSGEWQGKAGGYAIQGLAAGFVRELKGSYSGVVGLDLFQVHTLLTGAGFAQLPASIGLC